jgi:hypothetical protein
LRLQFYFNAHTWLGRRLERRGIDFTLLDNAFIEISDYDKAQRIAERLDGSACTGSWTPTAASRVRW